MIEVSDELAAVLDAGGFQHFYEADVIVDGQIVLERLPLNACQLDGDADRKVLTQGAATIVYSDELGRSIAPEDFTSWMNPYTTSLVLSLVVSAGGGFSERVLRGVMKVVAVSDPREHFVSVNDQLLTVGSSVRVRLADAFHVTNEERFAAPSAPSDLDSAWAEIQRVTGLGVLRNVSDAAIPRSVVYQQSRLDGTFELGQLLGGRPFVSREGLVAVLPDAWGEPVARLQIGAEGLVEAVDPAEWSDSGIYNQVVVRSHDNEQVSVLAAAQVLDGPLRFGGPFGRRPYFYSSEFITTEEQAQDYADAQLPKVSTLPAQNYSIQCAPDPRLEVGDVIEFTDRRENVLTGRIVSQTLPGPGRMSLTVQVQRG